MRKNVLLLASMALAVLLASGTALAASGDLDPTFGGDGRVSTGFTGSASVADLIVQPDGKLVAAGGRSVSVSWDRVDSAFALARYNSNGSPDKSFGTNGRVLTGRDRYGLALARQRDGKLVVAGYGGYDSQGKQGFALARYNPNGSLDRSFGDNGEAITVFDGGAVAYDLVVQPNGKLVAAGYTRLSFNSSSGSDFALARYNPDGSLDKSFGGDGKVISDLGREENISALVLQSNGKLVAAGTAFVSKEDNAAFYDFALARYNPDGSPDRTFGRAGRVTTSLGSRYDGISALVLQPDGKLVAGGSCCGGALDLGGRKTRSEFALVRYNPDGSLDGTFGRAAKVTTDFFGDEDGLGTLIQLPDGKLVAAGSACDCPGWPYPSDREFALARYHQSGALDTTFGTGGKVTTGFPGNTDYASALVRQGDGKLVSAGTTTNSINVNEQFALIRHMR